MRIHGRLGNPLLRRVQRHMHVATLFHGPAAEADDVPGVQPPGEARNMARPILPAVPAAAGMAVEPGLPETVLSQPGGERVQTMPAPAAAVPPAPTPAMSSSQVTPAAPMPRPVSPAAAPSRAEPPRTEEDRTWSRLQTIMRKHQEKEEAEQAAQSQPEQQPPAVPEPAPAPPAVQRSPAPPAAPQPVVSPSRAVDERAEAAPLPRRVSVEEISKTEPVQPAQTSAAERSLPPAAVTEPAAEKPAAVQRAVTEGPIQRAEAPLPTAPAPQAAARPQGLQPPAGPPAQPAEPISREDAAPAGPAGEVPPERPAVDAQALTLVQAPRTPIPAPEAAPTPAALRAEQPEAPAPAPLEARSVSTDETLVQAKPAARPAAEAHPVAKPLLAKAFVAGAPASPAEPAAADPAVAEPAVAADETVLQTRPAEGIPASPSARPERSEAAPEAPQAVTGAESAAAKEEPPVSQVFTPAPPARLAPPATPGVPAAAEEGTAAALPAAPLQAVWPVEHLEGEAVQRQVEPTIADRIEAKPVLPHDDRVGQILQSVAPGLASDSHVELVTPRRPRPSVVRAEKSVEAQPPAPSPGVPSEAALPAEQAVQPAVPVVQRQPVETEIGALPADLWSLIGEAAPASQPTAAAKAASPSPVEPPAPQPEEAQTIIAAKPPVAPPTVEQPAAAPAAVQAPQQSALQRHLDDEAVQRKAAGREPQPAARAKPAPPEPAPSSRQPLRETPSGEGYWTIPSEGVLNHEPEMAEDVMQRAIQVDEVTTEVAPANGGGEAPDVDELAQKVYSEIKRRLAVEFERFRRR